jgi:hypothetical protein
LAIKEEDGSPGSLAGSERPGDDNMRERYWFAKIVDRITPVATAAST